MQEIKCQSSPLANYFCSEVQKGEKYKIDKNNNTNEKIVPEKNGSKRVIRLLSRKKDLNISTSQSTNLFPLSLGVEGEGTCHHDLNNGGVVDTQQQQYQKEQKHSSCLILIKKHANTVVGGHLLTSTASVMNHDENNALQVLTNQDYNRTPQDPSTVTLHNSIEMSEEMHFPHIKNTTEKEKEEEEEEREEVIVLQKDGVHHHTYALSGILTSSVSSTSRMRTVMKSDNIKADISRDILNSVSPGITTQMYGVSANCNRTLEKSDLTNFASEGMKPSSSSSLPLLSFVGPPVTDVTTERNNITGAVESLEERRCCRDHTEETSNSSNSNKQHRTCMNGVALHKVGHLLSSSLSLLSVVSDSPSNEYNHTINNNNNSGDNHTMSVYNNNSGDREETDGVKHSNGHGLNDIQVNGESGTTVKCMEYSQLVNSKTSCHKEPTIKKSSKKISIVKIHENKKAFLVSRKFCFPNLTGVSNFRQQSIAADLQEVLNEKRNGVKRDNNNLCPDNEISPQKQMLIAEIVRNSLHHYGIPSSLREEVCTTAPLVAKTWSASNQKGDEKESQQSMHYDHNMHHYDHRSCQSQSTPDDILVQSYTPTSPSRMVSGAILPYYVLFATLIACEPFTESFSKESVKM